MKKILSILGAITLIGTSSTSLVACNKSNEYTAEELKELKEKNKINTKDKTIRDNLEWIARQEKPFNPKGDEKYYYIVWRGNKKENWLLKKYKNIGVDYKNTLIDKSKTGAMLHRISGDLDMINGEDYSRWYYDNHNYFKSVYRWNLDTPAPDLIVDDFGNIKVNGE